MHFAPSSCLLPLPLLPSLFPVSPAITSFPEVKDLPVRPEMPDVMTMADGTKVTTMEQWRQRREEMKEILEDYELGHAPPPPGNVSGQDLQSYPVLGGAANFRLVHLKFGPQEKIGLDIAISRPSETGRSRRSSIRRSSDTGCEFQKQFHSRLRNLHQQHRDQRTPAI